VISRLLACLALFAAFGMVPVQAAPVQREPVTAPTIAPEKKVEWTEADYKSARDRDDERQKTWDRKMKALTGSICTGC
jgi:hypothetical protein